MLVSYPAIFTRINDEKDTYLIYFPDLPVGTEGYGLENAKMMAEDYLYCKLADKSAEEIPKATAVADVKISYSEFSDAGESFIELVEVDIVADGKYN